MTDNLSKETQILINKFNRGDYSDVLKKISLIIKKDKDNFFLWNLSGLCFQKINKLKDAIYSFKKSIEINDKNIAAKNNLAIAYKINKEYSESEKILKDIVKQNPKYINALVNLANLKNETYFFDEALDYYNKALQIKQDVPEIYLNIANILQTNNKIEEAKISLFKSLKYNNFFTKADQNLSMLLSYKNKSNYDHLQSMEKKLQNNDLKDTEKVYLHFGLAKSYEDRKDFSNAFIHLKSGNLLKSQNQVSQIVYFKKLSEDIKKFFLNLDYTKIKRHSDSGKHIFILGLPRSGTTLLEKIISSHSKVGSVSEINFIFNKINQNIIKDKEFDNKKCTKFLNYNLHEKYEKFLENFNIKDEFVIDKTLTNFWYLGFIKIFFPNSKIIHSYRNSKDNCLSIYKNLFLNNEKWIYDEEELAKYYLIYDDLMKFWNSFFDNQILNISYEDLITDNIRLTKKIIEYCNLNWEEQCLNHQKNKNPIKTLSVNQANQAIYKTSINSSEPYKDKLTTMFSILKNSN